MYAAAVQDLIDELGRLPGVGPKSAQRIAFHLLKLSDDDALRLATAINVVKARVSWCRRCFNVAETDRGSSGTDRADRRSNSTDRADTGSSGAASSDAGSSDAGGGDAGGVPSGSGETRSDGPTDLDASFALARAAATECDICRDSRRDTTVLCVVEEPKDIVAVEKTREFRGRYHVLQGAISPIDGIGPEQLRIRELLARIASEGIAEIILCTNPNIEGDATALYLASLLKHLPARVTRIASGLPVGGDLEYADELTLGRALEGRREVGA